MAIVNGGELESLSVSQVETFDHEQNAGCQRKWWFNSVMGLRPEKQGAGAADGDKGHALLATYFRTGQRPPKKAKMGKAVTAAILKGDLPALGPDLLVEQRFDGSELRTDPDLCWCGHNREAGHLSSGVCTVAGCKCEAFGERWIPFDRKETLWLGGVPWDGFIDLAYRRGAIPTILDHKFTAHPEDAKRPSQLIRTVQLPVYVKSQLPYWPDAKVWEIAHHVIARTGTESKIISTCVEIDEVLERCAEIETLVEQMKLIARVTDQNDVPVNMRPDSLGRRACDAYGGCPHQFTCSAFRKGAVPVELSDEDKALFEGLDFAPAAPAAAAPAPRAADPFDDAMPTPPAHAAAPAAPAPAPAPAPSRMKMVAATCPHCKVELTVQNSSLLQDRVTLFHVGCPAAVAPVAPPDAPASKPELASEQPAPAAPPKEPKARKPRAAPPMPPAPGTAPTPAENPAVLAGVLTPVAPKPINHAAMSESISQIANAIHAETTRPLLPPGANPLTLAELFENIAKLIRGY